MARSLKMEQRVALEQLPDVLVQIAGGLRGEGIQANLFGGGMEFRKLKISVKKEYGQALIKVYVKAAEEKAVMSPEGADGEEPVAGRESYTTLKKRMKSSFKVLRAAVDQSMLPPEAAVREFLEDSKRMVSIPGYGDEFYEEYGSACASLERSCGDRDLDAVAAGLDRLAALKSRCHGLYK